MTYQKKTGTLSQGAHPGSYNGQDAYNDMLVTVPERERERVWVMTTEKNRVIAENMAMALRSRDYKDPPIVIMKRNMLHGD